MRRHWVAAIEGQESGTVLPLLFVRFWRRSSAQRWADRMNGPDPGTLVRYVVVER